MSEYALIVSAYPERPMTAILIKELSPLENYSTPHETISTTECTLDNLERYIKNIHAQYNLDSVTLYGPDAYICGQRFRDIEGRMAPLKFAFVGYNKDSFKDE